MDASFVIDIEAARKTSWFLLLKNLRRNPFVGALRSAPVITESDELSTGERVIRNQILTRSAPIIGRGLTAIGTTAVAYGVARSRIPRKPRPFTVVPKKEAKRLGRYKKGRYVHYKPENVWNRLPQIDVQERRARSKQLKPRTSPRVLKGAGTIMIVGGKALPTLAYGYVGYDIIRRRQRGENVSARRELEKTTFGIAIDDAPGIASDTWSSMQTVRHLAKPLLHMAWRLA